MKIHKILIANRGEIALRIIRSCREMGIGSVAVYSDVDNGSPHVLAADEAYRLGPAESSASYLDIEKLIAVARKSGADAIHPGYGFLAENGDFAEAVIEAGLLFIGPSPEVIRRMGDKVAAREAASRCGMPIIPGSPGPLEEGEDPVGQAESIGYPLLVKAAYGGGGKGMRVVRSPEDLEGALRQARGEAEGAFGDGTVYLERFLERPRHVEIQVFADTHGNAIHLGERDCSIQRRHQKLVEESPSTAVTPELRASMGEVAVRLTQEVGYVGAGTIELLLLPNGEYFFLEMNTRLQVEHAVTEMVTGIDLVALQIQVAEGESLPLTQDEIDFRGHAIECRIYAEDPYQGFIPSPGRVEGMKRPDGPFVRIDSGVRQGSEVTMYYDPMISKLIVWGRSRSEAISRMRRALSEYTLVGIQTSVPFHLAVMNHPDFISGDVSIRFLEESLVDGIERPDPREAALIAVALEHVRRSVAGARTRNPGESASWNPWKMVHRMKGRRS
ncbi:MAG: acetyl-CoA carboxylase biotin carboxylase subunit [Planctomycetota bacterium]|jgi:acetyl-CoA carboxylase biotin carboxylase subunit|nr:acetyl-CoA carboxylase biotin carboxylase subunit [Planctomycetota bacterium]